MTDEDDEDKDVNARNYPDYGGHRMVMKTCSVTMFDMRLDLTRDGRERGVWFWLRDRSPSRAEARTDAALFRTEQRLEMEKKMPGMTLFSFDNDRNPQFNTGQVEEAALIEWDELEEIYKAIGAELKKRKKKK